MIPFKATGTVLKEENRKRKGERLSTVRLSSNLSSSTFYVLWASCDTVSLKKTGRYVDGRRNVYPVPRTQAETILVILTITNDAVTSRCCF